MELEIDLRHTPARCRLIDPDELRSFAVVVVEAPRGEVSAWPPLIARHDEHVWVRIDALRALARPSVGPDWESGFAAMVEYARGKGWVEDDAGSVRGHVERRTGP